MKVYNETITNAFREIQLAGYIIKKLKDGKYQIEHIDKSFDKAIYEFDTLDELQAFGQGILIGLTLEFESEILLKKDTFIKRSKEVLDKLRQALTMLENITDRDFIKYIRENK